MDELYNCIDIINSDIYVCLYQSFEDQNEEYLGKYLMNMNFNSDDVRVKISQFLS